MPGCSMSAIWVNFWFTGAVSALRSKNSVPSDFQAAPDMKPKYSLLLDDGRIIDDLMATRRGEDYYIVVNGATKHGDIADMGDDCRAKSWSIR